MAKKRKKTERQPNIEHGVSVNVSIAISERMNDALERSVRCQNAVI
jgi:hypothetical protein